MAHYQPGEQVMNDTLRAIGAELAQKLAGRLVGEIEVEYGSIHLQLLDNLSSRDMVAIEETLNARFQTVRHWRIKQVNKLLLLSIVTGDAEQE